MVLLTFPCVQILIWFRYHDLNVLAFLERKISNFATSISIFYPYPLKIDDVIYGRPLISPCVQILIWLRSSMSWFECFGLFGRAWPFNVKYVTWEPRNQTRKAPSTYKLVFYKWKKTSIGNHSNIKIIEKKCIEGSN